jgi:hypothetical protein
VLEDFLGRQAEPHVTTNATPEAIEQFFAADPGRKGLSLDQWQDLLLDQSCLPEDFRWQRVERLPDGRLRFEPKEL